MQAAGALVPKKIMIIAGEASGDILGASFMHELKAQNPLFSFIGVGGEKMQEAGLKPLFPMAQIALMGVFEIVPHLPNIFKRIKQVAASAEAEKIDLLLTIDAQEFSAATAKKIRKKLGDSLPIIHYPPPKVWAWRPKRAKKYARYLTHVLAMFPFEPPYFENVGLPCTFIGHPLTENLGGFIEKSLPKQAPQPKLALLPGSRKDELKRHALPFIQTFRRLQQHVPNLKAVLPLTHPDQAAWLLHAIGDAPMHDIELVYGENRYVALANCRAALAKSGTSNLELAALKVPLVAAYSMNSLTFALLKNIVKVPYICPVNWVLGKKIVPEFYQTDMTPENLTPPLEKLLLDDDVWHKYAAVLAGVAQSLNAPAPHKTTAKAAAAVILQYLK